MDFPRKILTPSFFMISCTYTLAKPLLSSGIEVYTLLEDAL